MASAKRNRQRQHAALQEAAATVTPTSIRGDLVDLDEAALRADGTVPIRLISPGWGSSGYYSAAVLEAAADDNVFPAGTHMYWDHPTLSERGDRPERSLRDLAAVTESDATWRDDLASGPGLYAQARVFETYRPLLTEMAPHIGVSIRAGAQISTGEAEGRRGRIVDRLVEGQSVDFVTRPGRGGQILAVLEANRVAEAGLWNDEVRQLLRTALLDRFPQDDGGYLWVRDWDDTNVVFDLDGSHEDLDAGTYQLGYTATDSTVTLSDDEPTKVQVSTTYEPVGESRNVGEWFQSRIHLHFTTLADDMFGDGRLTKDERIALSSGIGAALDAFSELIEQRAPQLLTRDLWDQPAATQPTQSEEDYMPITQEERAAIAAEAATAVISQLTEAGVIVTPGTTDVDESTRQVSEATERAERAERALLIESARRRVADHAKVKALPAVARDAVVNRVVNEAKATDDGQLDTAALDEATTTAVEAEVKYLTEATGSPVVGAGDGGGDGSGGSVEEANEKLEASFRRLGLSESAAKTAVAGRR